MDLNKLLKTVGAKRAELDARSGKNNAVKPPAGKSRWRILPGWRKGQEDVFFHDFYQHWIKDEEGNVKGVVLCEAKTFGRECACCEALSPMIKSARDDKTIKALKEMGGRGGYLVNALRMDGGDANPKQPKVLMLGSKAFEELVSLIQTRGAEEIALLDAENGYDVIIDRSGTGFDTEYHVNDVKKPTKVDPEALANLHDLDAWVEGERSRGLAKLALFEPTARALLGYGASASSMLVPTSAARMLPARRAAPVIEPDDDDAVVVPEVREEPEATPVVSKTKIEETAVAKALADAPIDDDDIEALLKDL